MEAHPPAPSDRLRGVYEERAELEYPAPEPLPDPALDRKFERVCELVAEQLPCRRYLDAGCGDGRYLAALTNMPARPRQIWATDISERILDVAQAAAAGVGIAVKTKRANLEALPYSDRSFDVVLCTQAIEHLLDPARGLAELARVLAPGGRVVLTTDHSRNVVTQLLNLPRSTAVRALGWRGRRAKVSFPHRHFGRGELVRLARAAGLDVERTETFRFTLMHPFDVQPAVRLLNGLDRRLSGHNALGDLIALVARKPG